MDPLTGAALISGGIGAATSIFGQSSANRQNKREAKKNRQWQEAQATTAFQRNQQAAKQAHQRSLDAANTSHQREVDDLRKAGLNPILSAGGSGAPAPASPAATAQSGSGGAARVDSVTKDAAEAATKSTALGLETQRKQNELLKTQEEATYSQAQKNHWESEQARKNANYVLPLMIEDWQNKVKVTANTAQNIAAQTETLKAELVGKLVESDIDRSEYGQLMRHLGRAIPMINAAGNAIPFRDVLNAFDRKKGNRSRRSGPYTRPGSRFEDRQ